MRVEAPTGGTGAVIAPKAMWDAIEFRRVF
jgi:hypothetical protein